MDLQLGVVGVAHPSCQTRSPLRTPEVCSMPLRMYQVDAAEVLPNRNRVSCTDVINGGRSLLASSLEDLVGGGVHFSQ